MYYYSTNDRNLKVSLKDAVLKGLPEDNGLFMPSNIPLLPKNVLSILDKLTFQEISFHVAQQFLEKEVPLEKIEEIVYETIQFKAPMVSLRNDIYILELFHGPSLAFKDFGARFMARLMAFFLEDEKKDLIILVATSGDTGGAVAAGFHQAKGVKVVILYPSGKVSKVQESQLTSNGDNIYALEVAGSFDDCQKMVKSAFLDPSLRKKLFLSSANSINISRLIPQIFYYFEGSKGFQAENKPSFIVPSGNFGNITAGILAKKMGAPINQLIASTNMNDVVPEYLNKGKYLSKPSVQTLANAMDVGNPSNFARILDIFNQDSEGSTWNKIKSELKAYRVGDSEIISQIDKVFTNQNYLLEPHSSTGYYTAKKLRDEGSTEPFIILGTAHPIKFKDEIHKHLPKIPEEAFGQTIFTKDKLNHYQIENKYSEFKELLGKLFHVKQD